MYHIEFITEDGWETAFASCRRSACLLADALEDCCGDDIRVYHIQAAESEDESVEPVIKILHWRDAVVDGQYTDIHVDTNG
ncbi:MAG: hypothetical protein HRT35_24270 [Algicola sp.]|nr:hypothetical protein [Algicola sp.]